MKTMNDFRRETAARKTLQEGLKGDRWMIAVWKATDNEVTLLPLVYQNWPNAALNAVSDSLQHQLSKMARKPALILPNTEIAE